MLVFIYVFPKDEYSYNNSVPLHHQGMNYLEEHRIVHRNLAARNVLLNNNFTAQISDYGIADLLYPDEKKYSFNESKVSFFFFFVYSFM